MDGDVAAHTSLQEGTVDLLSTFSTTSFLILSNQVDIPATLIPYQSAMSSTITYSEEGNSLQAIASHIQADERMGLEQGY